MNDMDDFFKIWEKQMILKFFEETISAVGKIVHDDILNPPAGISNISEWCKKDGCWKRLQGKMPDIRTVIPNQFVKELVGAERIREQVKSASQIQTIDSGIELLKQVMEI